MSMSKMLNVLFVSSEVDPFAKTGGLADVSGALPQALKELGIEVRIIMPRYGAIDEEKFRLHEVIRLRDIPIPVGHRTEVGCIRSAFIVGPKTKVQVYFLSHDNFFGNRDSLYVDSSTKKDYPDNDERFIFFDRSVLEMLKRLGWQPDIIHCNDWQTGLIPAYLKTIYKSDPFFKDVKTIFTIHNIAYQGSFPRSSFEKTGLPAETFTPDGVEFYGNLNFLKAGLVYSDILTTVSERYAEEIRTLDEYGAGMTGILQKRRNDLYGIVNGIDYSVWNPAVDSLIPYRYNLNTLDNKAENKKILLRKYNLQFDPTKPLIGSISRLADQKGFDLIAEVSEELMKRNLQYVILGTGEKKYHELFESLRKKYPTKIGVYLGFNNELAHLIEAGADMFLMPSRYEPCGLNQLYSLKYGTVPIVRSTGGLADTIEDVDLKTGKGTGFKFTEYNGSALLEAIDRALKAWQNQALWRKIMKEGMSRDFSWETSAKKYLSLYKKLAKKS
ncbi:MAG: glycogen synthase GlgA [Bacteroidota bacterium]